MIGLVAIGVLILLAGFGLWATHNAKSEALFIAGGISLVAPFVVLTLIGLAGILGVFR